MTLPITGPNPGLTLYLPVTLELSLAVDALDADALKAAKSRAMALASVLRLEQVNDNFVLHTLANRLGFRGGWGQLQKDISGRLGEFRATHGLLRQADVLAVPYDCPFRLSYRQIADRLFASGRPAPRRIFTGHSTDWWALLRRATGSDGLKVVELGQEHLGLDADGVDQANLSTRVPPARYVIANADGFPTYFGVAGYFCNIIGDQLCGFNDPGTARDHVATIYFYGDENTHAPERARLAAAGRILETVLGAGTGGWLEVIPFNDRLAFLKAADGDYAFVFRGARDEPGPVAAIGASTREQAFRDWLYHRQDGWLEADRHAAETAFYRDGGTPASYPGENAVLREFLESSGRYKEPRKAAFRNEKARLFRVAAVGAVELAFSPLVTTGEFKEFLLENPDYLEARNTNPEADPWEPVNLDGDACPAAVTQPDAVAYARCMRQKLGLPVRLPEEHELLALAGELVPATVSWTDLAGARKDRLCVFHEPGGRAIDGHPPYMSPENFDRLELRYRDGDLPMVTARSGLEVLQSLDFGEWLEPNGAAINTKFFCSQYDVTMAHHVRVAASRGLYAPGSTGKYRGEKIGFRLIYEVTKASKRKGK